MQEDGARGWSQRMEPSLGGFAGWLQVQMGCDASAFPGAHPDPTHPALSGCFFHCLSLHSTENESLLENNLSFDYHFNAGSPGNICLCQAESPPADVENCWGSWKKAKPLEMSWWWL